MRRHGRRPDLVGLRRFTDQLYRIKTDGSSSNPLHQPITDKELAKQYIENAVGPGYVPGTYQVLRSVGDVRAFEPDHVPCVLKPTHLSGPVLFHTNPEKIIDCYLLCRWLVKERYRGT